jgi:transposase
MIQVNPSNEEVTLLHAYADTSPIKLLRKKSEAILLRSRSILIKDIAFSLNASYRTVERWIKDFSERRMASIFNGLVGNEHAAKLTKEQKEEKSAQRTTLPVWITKRILGCTPVEEICVCTVWGCL